MLKETVAVVCLIITAPLIGIARLAAILNYESVFMALGCLLSLIPGKTGSYLRVAYYRGTLAEMHTSARIGFGSFFSKPTARVGKGTFIGAYCVLGRVHIGDQVLIASRVSVTSGRHQHGDAGDGVRFGPTSFAAVSIGEKTWIGEGAIVLASVGADCIVGAGAVVVSDIPDGSLAVGNPARPKPR